MLQTKVPLILILARQCHPIPFLLSGKYNNSLSLDSDGRFVVTERKRWPIDKAQMKCVPDNINLMAYDRDHHE